MQLALVHARFQFLETVRVPIAVIGNTVFPPLILLFFVVPNPEIAANPVAATGAVASRGARDLLVTVLTGAPPSTVAVLALPVWIVLTALLAGWAYQRDEGRRFR